MNNPASHTLLLVEDEAIIALSERKQLERAGYRVVVASNGEQAIEVVCNNRDPIDLIQMDIDLGGEMDGTQVAERILSMLDLPIVFLTGQTERGMVIRVKGITNYGYVVKNSGEFVLLESISMALQLFESANDAIVVVTADDRLVDFDRKACQLWGYSRAELLNMTVADLQAPEARGAPGSIIRSESEASGGRRFVGVDMRRDGVRIPVEITAAPLDEEGESQLFISIVRDVTERLRIERELRGLLAEKDILLDTRSRIRAVTSIYDCFFRADSLEHVDLARCVEEVATSIMETYATSEDGIRLKTTLRAVEIDIRYALPIGLILNELITNAVKYAYPESAHGELRVELTEQSGKVRLRVADDGVGLPEGFDIGKVHTTGITLVRALAEQIGGSLSIENDGGTAIVVGFTPTQPEQDTSWEDEWNYR